MSNGEKREAQNTGKSSLFKATLNGLAVILAAALAATGFYWIISSNQELPTGASILVVGSSMVGITVLKSLAENKRDKVTQAKVIGPEVMTGFAISVIGIIWHHVA